MTQLTSAEHVSPQCVKLRFSGPMRNNNDLRDPQYYSVNGGVTVNHVDVEYAQNQPFVSSPGQLGGVPEAVYLLLDTNPYNAGSTIAGLTASGLTTLLDADGSNLSAPQTVSLTTIEPVAVSYWTGEGRRTKETFDELNRVGRVRFTEEQPLNRSTAFMIGKLNDIMSGGSVSKLGADIPGELTPEYLTTFSPAGFSTPVRSTSGIGDTITFLNSVIPCHVDKLWGRSNGSNRLFRTSAYFHPHAFVLVAATGDVESVDDGIVDGDRWFAPNSGFDRQIVMKQAPPEGVTLLAIYIPRRSLLLIGQEIIAYDESDIHAGTAVIYGRAQLSTLMAAHSELDEVEDVWSASFVKRAEYNILAWGASGRALEYIGLDSGSPRSDNPRLSDTDLRRMIFHTSVTMRGVPGTVWEGIRYIYPNLWPHLQIGEDPRWPGCITIWYHADVIIGDLNWITSPRVEPWETWLDDLSWADGSDAELIAETYYRDDVVDAGSYGDYFLEDWSEEPEIWPFPVVVSGPDVLRIGEVAADIPPPANVSPNLYKQYLIRPAALDKVLPIGCSVLLLDATLL